MTSLNGNGTEMPQIRLCHMIKWDDYDGYGFNLHAEKNKPGQFIGKIDEGSPAEAAGLREGDKIIEVNGSNITTEDHKAVVNKIKQKPNETSLLVVDKSSVEYYAKNGIVISSSLAEVVTLKTPPRSSQVTTEKSTGNGDIEAINNDVNGNQKENRTSVTDKPEIISNGATESAKTNGIQETIQINGQQEKTQSNGQQDKIMSNGQQDKTENNRQEENIKSNGLETVKSNGISDLPNVAEVTKATSLASESPKSQKSVTSSEGSKEEKGKLNLNMSAEEFRTKLALRKKFDPKKENMDVKKKYEIIDQL